MHQDTKSTRLIAVCKRTFNSKKVHEDNIFGRQDILHLFSEVSTDYKYVKSPKLRIVTLIELPFNVLFIIYGQ